MNLENMLQSMKSRRLAHAPVQFILWSFLIDPKKLLRFLPIASAREFCKLIGSERYSRHFNNKLVPLYGRLIDESHVFFNIPGIGQLVFPSDAGFILEEVFVAEVYDRCFKLSSGSTILDVGAHAGSFSVKMAKEVERGLIIAIEPHPSNFKLLLQNIRMNKLSNVIPLNLAISEKKGNIRLYVTEKSYTPSTVLREGYALEVPADTLDNVVRKLKLGRIDLIKIDAEGAELGILKSGAKLLQSNGLKLSIAAYHTPSEAYELTEFLMTNGYTVWSFGDYLYAFKCSNARALKS